MKKAKPGSVSHGTMRTDDLIKTFLDFLEEHNHPDVFGLRDDCQSLSDLDILLNEDIWDAMQDLAPYGFYFGAHPGDGSDFGFWECEEQD